jgi:hypothetical protein
MNLQDIIAHILRETREVGNRFEREFADDPDGELLAWLELAVQRETMVTYLYERANVDERLSGREGAVKVARDALTLIWQQEKSHATTLAVRLVDGVFAGDDGRKAAAIAKVRGQVEGTVLDWLTKDDGAKRVLARMVTWIGSRLDPSRVPEFALAMPTSNAGEFFRLAAALETTARESYERLSEVLARVVIDADSLQPHGLVNPILDTLSDETFHEKAFEEMSTWVREDGTFNPELDGVACMHMLKDILVATTGVPRRRTRGAEDEPLIVRTDGGLGPLFAEYGITFTVVGSAVVPPEA